MIICFESTPKTKQLLDRLIDEGNYSDYSEAISLAIQNLDLLEGRVSSEGQLIIERADGGRALGKRGAPDQARALQRPGVKGQAAVAALVTGVPTIFGRLPKLDPKATVAEPPSSHFSKDEVVPIDRWLFGQYNRILPAKAACRALAFLMTSNPNGIDLDSAALSIAEHAGRLREYLVELDATMGFQRDTTLATAFPRLDVKAEKSKLRFANQFVASINNHGEVSGLLFELKLLNRIHHDGHRVSLTTIGWEFAEMFNPIFDADPSEIEGKLTREEIDFLLHHISDNVPAEDFAYRAVLSEVQAGHDTPTSIDMSLNDVVPVTKGAEFSQSFLSSQRSGAVSRMADLQLLKRARKAQSVRYEVTDLGIQYAANSKRRS